MFTSSYRPRLASQSGLFSICLIVMGCVHVKYALPSSCSSLHLFLLSCVDCLVGSTHSMKARRDSAAVHIAWFARGSLLGCSWIVALLSLAPSSISWARANSVVSEHLSAQKLLCYRQSRSFHLFLTSQLAFLFPCSCLFGSELQSQVDLKMLRAAYSSC